MSSTLLLTDIVLTPARPADLATGLIGFVACTVNLDLRLDGLALRRTTGGAYSITFPERRDSNGVRHPIVRPIDARARADIERQIIGTLRQRGAMT